MVSVLSKRIGLMLAMLFINTGCATSHWINPDSSRDWKTDLGDCNFNSLKNVCINTAAVVSSNCTTNNGVTSCKPVVIPPSSNCHDELQMAPRDRCLEELGWSKAP